MQSCPKSEKEWKKASRFMKCQKNDEYHCVRDGLKEKLIIVCAPNIPIVGRHYFATVKEVVNFVCGYLSPANMLLSNY